MQCVGSSICFTVILLMVFLFMSVVFFFNDAATTEIYTLSLHDALPISFLDTYDLKLEDVFGDVDLAIGSYRRDRKSTRLNSSHVEISYAVFCLKKKRNRSQVGREVEDDGPESSPCHDIPPAAIRMVLHC